MQLAFLPLRFYGGVTVIPNPHDLMFKAVFGQPEHARGMLQAIVPPAVAEAIDWNTRSDSKPRTPP